MLRPALMLIALAMAMPATAEVYRCEKNGETIFSDSPCGENAENLGEVTAPRPSANFGGDADPEEDTDQNKPLAPAPGACREFSQSDLKRLGVQEKIAEGMTKGQLRDSWGTPDTINSSSTGRDQWVYRWSNTAHQYVYFIDGCVTNWQTYKSDLN